MDRSEHNLSTDDLLLLLKTTPDSFHALDLAAELPLQAHLERLMKARGSTPAELMEKAGLSKSFTYQILAGERLPGRDVLLRLAFVLRLGVEEAQRLLTVGRKGVLYPKVRRDAALLRCLQKGCTLLDAEEFLEAVGEASLM